MPAVFRQPVRLRRDRIDEGGSVGADLRRRIRIVGRDVLGRAVSENDRAENAGGVSRAVSVKQAKPIW